MNKKIEEILERIEKESVRYFYSTHEEYESGFYASNAVGELIEIHIQVKKNIHQEILLQVYRMN